MIDQYFGVKELYEAVLRVKTPMQFGSRMLEADEPVLYFENVSISTLSERNNTIMARGGWSNMPRVIWEDRSEVRFQLSEGVLSSISMSILLSTNMAARSSNTLNVPKREGPFELQPYENPEDNKVYNVFYIQHLPISYPDKKTFIFKYKHDVAQQKVYGKLMGQNALGFYRIAVFEDKNLQINAEENGEKYVIDYYYKYDDTALLYTVQKERFNGLFTLEGKFYSKDENKGLDYTNLLYMPKVRVVSDINLRLGERADPTVGTFNIIGLPVNTNENTGLIVEITRLNSDIDGDL